MRRSRSQDANVTIYEPGNGVTLPTVEEEVRPVYTDAAKTAGIDGVVVLEDVVMPDGRTDRVSVVQSLDPTYGLDAAAVDALKAWRFKPGTKEGKAVAVRIHVQMTFTLK